MGKFGTKKVIYLFTLLLIISPLASFSYFMFESSRSNSRFITNVEANKKAQPNLSDLPDIPYSELNELWYEPKIEMLIISPEGNQDFYDACVPLMDWKNEKGVKTLILNNYSKYSGADSPERISNMIKSYYETENIRWVLLAGDAEDTLVPIRYVYNPDVLRWGQGKVETQGNEYLKPTDYYYADLTGDWDDDGDGNYGESPDDNDDGDDEIDWIPEVYVGRLPATTATQLEIMINKTLKYETDPEVGEWMNQMLLAGGVSDLIDQKDPDGEDESRLTDFILQNYVKITLTFC